MTRPPSPATPHGQLTPAEHTSINQARAAATTAAILHATLRTRIAARIIHDAFPTAAAIDVDTRDWDDNTGGLHVVAVHDTNNTPLWAHNHDPLPDTAPPPPPPAWTQTTGPYRHTIIDAAAEQLLNALDYGRPLLIGWHQLPHNACTGTCEDHDLYRVHLPPTRA